MSNRREAGEVRPEGAEMWGDTETTRLSEVTAKEKWVPGFILVLRICSIILSLQLRLTELPVIFRRQEWLHKVLNKSGIQKIQEIVYKICRSIFIPFSKAKFLAFGF